MKQVNEMTEEDLLKWFKDILREVIKARFR